jgi:hypothetical protein
MKVQAKPLDEALAAVYRDNPPLIARLCDHHLDPTGALLGRVRALVRTERVNDEAQQ